MEQPVCSFFNPKETSLKEMIMPYPSGSHKQFACSGFRRSQLPTQEDAPYTGALALLAGHPANRPSFATPNHPARRSCRAANAPSRVILTHLSATAATPLSAAHAPAWPETPWPPPPQETARTADFV